MTVISSKVVERNQEIKNFLRNQGILIVLIAVIIVMSLVRTDTFFTVRKLSSS